MYNNDFILLSQSLKCLTRLKVLNLAKTNMSDINLKYISDGLMFKNELKELILCCIYNNFR